MLKITDLLVGDPDEKTTNYNNTIIKYTLHESEDDEKIMVVHNVIGDSQDARDWYQSQTLADKIFFLEGMDGTNYNKNGQV